MKSRLQTADLGAALLLAVVCLLLRLPTLDRVALNPDESQYEASAAYLVANGESAFAFPYGVPWTMSLYKAVASLVGPYSMAEVRILVLLVALGSAWMLYDTLRRVAGRGAGLAGGVLFLHVNQAFEGWTVNREWFSFFPLLAGVYVVVQAWERPERGRWWPWLLAGLLCGASLWFKRQASFLVLVVPAVLLWQAWVERGTFRERLRELLPFAAGGILAGVVFVFPFLIHGTADVYVGSLFDDYNLFVVENEVRTQAQAGGALGLFATKLYWTLPHRAVFLVSYLFAGLVVLGALLRGLRKRVPWAGPDNPIVVLFAFYLIAAMLCVQLGNRFFQHYFLYAVAPLVAVFVLAAHCLGRLAGSGPSRGLALLVSGVFVADRLLAMIGGSVDAIALAYVVTGMAILIFALLRPLQRAGTLLVLLLVLESAAVLVIEQRRPVPRSFPYHPDAFEDLANRVETLADEGDRVFVWGWVPEIYSALRLEPASHMTITQYIVEDYYITPRGPTINRPLAELLMRGLEETPPRFIVDAAERSWTDVAGGDPFLYRLGQYPDFELVRLLREEYTPVGLFNRCRLYVRKPIR